jgi:hypothetical protein
MNPIYVPLLSALGGAIVGSLSSIATLLIQARIGERRERIRQAAMMALEELKIQLAHAPPGTGVFPISVYLYHHLAILQAVEENDLTPDRLRKIAAADDTLIAAVKELDRQFRSKSGAPNNQKTGA